MQTCDSGPTLQERPGYSNLRVHRALFRFSPRRRRRPFTASDVQLPRVSETSDLKCFWVRADRETLQIGALGASGKFKRVPGTVWDRDGRQR
jgi:hypothetical protein